MVFLKTQTSTNMEMKGFHKYIHTYAIYLRLFSEFNMFTTTLSGLPMITPLSDDN